MSKKDYIAIAEALRKEFDSVNTCKEGACIERIALALCEVFQAENPRFNRITFLAACGIQH